MATGSGVAQQGLISVSICAKPLEKKQAVNPYSAGAVPLNGLYIILPRVKL